MAAAAALPTDTESVEPQLVPAGDVDLAVRSWGRGPPLYLLHGGPGASGAYWPRFLPPGFAERFALHAVDLRGHGLSERRGPYRLRTLADDLSALADSLGHPRAAVMGHSLGALVGLRAALADPRFDRLVLVGGFPRTWRLLTDRAGWRAKAAMGFRLARWNAEHAKGRAPPVRGLLRALLKDAEPLMHGPRTPPWADDALFASALEPLDAVVPLQAELARFDAWPELARLRARTLVVNGEHDLLARPDAAGMAARIPAGRLVTLRGCGHSPFVDDPDGFRDAVLPFLAEDLSP